MWLHLSILLESESGSFEVPVQYNYPVQSAIYQALTKDVGGFFHDTGFDYKGRSFKMFTFSRLLGKSTLDRENMVLSVMGTILGLFLGILLHKYVIYTMEIDIIMFGRNIHLSSYIYSIILTMMFSMMVNLLMYNKLKNIDMVESLKSVE